MTEKVEKWNVNESFMTNPSYNSLSKCPNKLAISYLRAKRAPLSPFVLFLSSLSAGNFFSIFKMLGVTERASLRRPTRPVLMLFVGLSLLPGSALLSDSSCTSQSHIWCIEMWSPKNQPNPRVSTAMETPRDDLAEPGPVNPGVTRRSVGRNREGHLWASYLPDTVTKTSGGPSRGLCGGRAYNVNIIMSQGKKQQPSTRNPRAYIHGIHFLSNWASWHLMQAPDLSRVPFPQWNRGKVITIMRGPWKDGLKDLKWEEGAACQIPLLFCLLHRDLGMVMPSPTLGWMNASTELNTLIHSLWKSRHTFHTPGRFVVVGRSRKKKIGKGEKEEVNRSLRWDC